MHVYGGTARVRMMSIERDIKREERDKRKRERVAYREIHGER